MAYTKRGHYKEIEKERDTERYIGRVKKAEGVMYKLKEDIDASIRHLSNYINSLRSGEIKPRHLKKGAKKEVSKIEKEVEVAEKQLHGLVGKLSIILLLSLTFFGLILSLIETNPSITGYAIAKNPQEAAFDFILNILAILFIFTLIVYKPQYRSRKKVKKKR